MKIIKVIRLGIVSLLITLAVVGIKYILHKCSIEPIEQTSLHNALVSSAIFVLGFLLSSTMNDYKESERIPAQFASTVDDMYNDAKQLHETYPNFSLQNFRKALLEILQQFRLGTRKERHTVRREIAQLHHSFNAMEKAGVPPNFVTKLKQQSAGLSNSLFRVNYIQKIHFLPSASILGWLIAALTVGTLLLTNMSTNYGETAITGGVTFIIVYILLLIQVLRMPFQEKGTSLDDISLFLIREVKDYLLSEEAADKRQSK